MDAEALVAAGGLLQKRPRTRADLDPPLGGWWPDRDATSLGYAITYLVPLVQVARGIRGAGGRPT